MTTYVTAEDAILKTLKTAWDLNTPAITTTVPHMVYEFVEDDLKPHPRDSGKPWARAVIRHSDAQKASLRNSEQLSRFRRYGLVWVQVFVPAGFGRAWTTAQLLANVAASAYEGKRTTGGEVIFTKVQIIDVAKDDRFVRKDIRAYFYWDEVK